MITPYLSDASAIRIGAALLVLAGAAIHAACRRDQPTNWDAPAGDLNADGDVDPNYPHGGAA